MKLRYFSDEHCEDGVALILETSGEERVSLDVGNG